LIEEIINIGFLRLGEFTSNFYLKEIEHLSKAYNKPFKITEIEVDFEEWNQHLPYGFEKLEPKLTKALIQLNSHDIDCIVIPNITLHFTLDRLNLPMELKNKIIHPIKETIAYLNDIGINRITLLGTKYTMNSELMNSYFIENEISLKILSSNQINEIDKLRSEVFEGGYSNNLEKRLNFLTLTNENSILACTELSILNQENKILDLSKIQLTQIFK
jgi:aspartate racemase